MLQTQDLQSDIEAAVEKYRVEFQNMRNALLSFLPYEIFLKCLSFVGKDHYGRVALASKKLCKANKEEFGKDGTNTSYLEAAMTLNTARYCIEEGKTMHTGSRRKG